MKKNPTQQTAIARDWRNFRTRFKYSQEKLATALGISRRTVQYVESGNPDDPNWSCIPSPATQQRFKVLKTIEKQKAHPGGSLFEDVV